MTEFKLPLERYYDTSGVASVDACLVDALERAYADVCRERDEAYAALASARAAAADATKVHASQVARLTRRAENWEASHADQERSTLAFLEDLKRVTKERDAARFEVAKLEVGWEEHHRDYEVARAEVARLKRVKAAAKEWSDLWADAWGDREWLDEEPSTGQVVEHIIKGIGPDGEVKP